LIMNLWTRFQFSHQNTPQFSSLRSHFANRNVNLVFAEAVTRLVLRK
jgi:hypothetical protein